ncbi:hypothetical protein AMECASPLE_034303 [Ameca splendens]|uniref:Uncharacterized protein n=1 Tax=Ameca splendens TaxID=208324 RepID=A0ABV1A3K3_9TELE
MTQVMEMRHTCYPPHQGILAASSGGLRWSPCESSPNSSMGFALQSSQDVAQCWLLQDTSERFATPF